MQDILSEIELVPPDWYTDQDLGALEAVSTWESEQMAATRKKALMRTQMSSDSALSPKRLRKATKPEARKELEEAFKPALAPKTWQKVVRQVTMLDLESMAESAQIKPDEPSSQMLHYRKWRDRLIKTGETNTNRDLDRANIFDAFPEVEFGDEDQLFMLFNVAELLPKKWRNPELEERLKKTGFPYRCERERVDAERKETIRLVRQTRARNKAQAEQERAEWEARQREREQQEAEQKRLQEETEQREKQEAERRKKEAEAKQAERRRILQEQLEREAQERQQRIAAEKRRTEAQRQAQAEREQQEAKRKRQAQAEAEKCKAEQQKRRAEQARQTAAEVDWQFEVLGSKINATVQRFVHDLLKILF